MLFMISLRAKSLFSALISMALVLVGVAMIALIAYERVARDVVQQRDTELARVSAARLVVSPSTVKFHVSNILSKPGVASRTEAVALALQHNLVT